MTVETEQPNDINPGSNTEKSSGSGSVNTNHELGSGKRREEEKDKRKKKGKNNKEEEKKSKKGKDKKSKDEEKADKESKENTAEAASTAPGDPLTADQKNPDEIDIPPEVLEAAQNELNRSVLASRIKNQQQLDDAISLRNTIEKLMAAKKISLTEGARRVQEVNNTITALGLLGNQVGPTQDIQELIKGLARELSGQTPEALKPPTKERAVLQMRKEGELKVGEVLTEDKYEHYVEQWFDNRIRSLEISTNQNFEEQQPLIAPIMLAYTQLEMEPETTELGRKMHALYDERRVLHRENIIWKFNVLEGIFKQSAGVDVKFFENIFTTPTEVIKLNARGEKTSEMQHLVADKFREIETLGQELIALRQSEKDADKKEKTGKKVAVSDKQNEIRDMLEHGGYRKDKDGNVRIDEHTGKPITTEQLIQYTKLQLKRTDLSDYDRKLTEVTIKNLEQEMWASMMAARIASMWGRFGHYGLVINGTGDIFMNRLLNLSEALSKDAFHDGMKGAYDPKEGPYKNKPIDVGAVDFISACARKLTVNDYDIKPGRYKDKDKGSLKEPAFTVLGLDVKKDLKIEQAETDKGGKQDKLVKINDLSNANIHTHEFWQMLYDNGVSGSEYMSWLDKQNRADATRQVLLGYGGYFNQPTAENLLEVAKAYENFSEPSFEGEKGKGRHSSKQQQLYELLDRSLYVGMKGEGKKDKDGDWYVFRSAESYNRIKGAYNAGIITEKHKNKLFTDYCGFPIISRLFGAERVAGAKRRAALTLSFWRMREARSLTIGSAISETIKQGLAYVFGETR